MIAAFVAASAMLMSCETDTEAPTITVMLNGSERTTISVPATETVTMRIEWEADAGTRLDRITLDVENGANVEGFPVTGNNFETNNLHRLTGFVIDPPSPTGGEVVLVTRVEDRNGGSSNRRIVVTFTAPDVPQPPDRPGTGETALGEPTTHAFVYVSQGNAGNTITPAIPGGGFIWFSIPINPGNVARFRANGTNGGIVMLANEAAHNAITTKEALIMAYIDGTRVTDIDVPFDDFTPRYFIVRSGNTYSLVAMTALTRNSATISVRQ